VQFKKKTFIKCEQYMSVFIEQVIILSFLVFLERNDRDGDQRGTQSHKDSYCHAHNHFNLYTHIIQRYGGI